MDADLIPTPGWIAYTLGRNGHEMVLSVLAGAQLELNNQIREQFPDVVMLAHGQANPFFTVLANSDDPGWDLDQFWRAQTERFPYLAGVIGPLVGWLEHAPQTRLDRIRDVAATLARVDVRGLSEHCDGGVLVEIHNELCAIAERIAPVEYTPLDLSLRSALITQLLGAGQVLEPGDACGDLACGGGTRLVACGMALALTGHNPRDYRYYGADFDPMALAIAGVTCASFGLTDVHLSLHPTPQEWTGQIKLMLMNLGEMIDRDLAGPMQQAYPELGRVADAAHDDVAWGIVDEYQYDYLTAHKMIEAYGVRLDDDPDRLVLPVRQMDAAYRAHSQSFLGKHAVTKLTETACSCPPQAGCPQHGGLRKEY